MKGAGTISSDLEALVMRPSGTSTVGRVVIRGSLAGLAATIAMSAVMLAARRAGMMGKLPPERITEAGLRRLNIRASETSQNALSTLAHLGYGAGGGALFAALQRLLKDRMPPLAGGLGYGLLIWVVSYAGWVPALGIMPPPQRDRRRRPTAMVIAHLVYGGALGLLGRGHPGRADRVC
jgi:hypothetical protein